MFTNCSTVGSLAGCSASPKAGKTGKRRHHFNILKKRQIQIEKELEETKEKSRSTHIRVAATFEKSLKKLRHLAVKKLVESR